MSCIVKIARIAVLGTALAGCALPGMKPMGYYAPTPSPIAPVQLDPKFEMDKIGLAFAKYKWPLPALSDATFVDYGVAEMVQYPGGSLVIYPYNWGESHFEMFFLSKTPKPDVSIFNLLGVVPGSVKTDGVQTDSKGNEVNGAHDHAFDSFLTRTEGAVQPGAFGLSFGLDQDTAIKAVTGYCKSQGMQPPQVTIHNSMYIYDYVDDMFGGNTVEITMIFFDEKLFAYRLYILKTNFLTEGQFGDQNAKMGITGLPLHTYSMGKGER